MHVNVSFLEEVAAVRRQEEQDRASRWRLGCTRSAVRRKREGVCLLWQRLVNWIFSSSRLLAAIKHRQRIEARMREYATR
jgi:hypothetical protein